MKTKEYKSISGWNDLKPYGITLLTGEACAYSMRGLCDLTKEGVTLMQSFFGGTMAFQEGTNWNSGAVSSCMIPYSLFPELARFILFSVDDYSYVIQWSDNSFTGINDTKQAKEGVHRVYTNLAKNSAQPSVDGRNVHQATGRTV